MISSALLEPLSLLLISVALCDLPRFLAALLNKHLMTPLQLDMSDAMVSKELVLFAWALSVSLLLDDFVLAEILIVSLYDLSVPLLGLLAGAWPEIDVDAVLVFIVLGCKASVRFLVLDPLTLDNNLLGDISLRVFSQDKCRTSLNSLSGLTTDGKLWLGVESNGVGSLVHDEP